MLREEIAGHRRVGLHRFGPLLATLREGHTLTLLTRSSPRETSTGTKRWLHWRPGLSGDWESALTGVDGVINLAGEPIAKKRWTIKQKHQLRLSRIDTTIGLVRAIARAKQKPKFLLNASAVGYYGPRGDMRPSAKEAGRNRLLAALCRDWENEAMKAESSACGSSACAPASCSAPAAAR
jgi:NAD dependent epimerase/dehydratase family enzyme